MAILIIIALILLIVIAFGVKYHKQRQKKTILKNLQDSTRKEGTRMSGINIWDHIDPNDLDDNSNEK